MATLCRDGVSCTCINYRIHGNFHATKFLLYSMLTRFSRFYFRWPHILRFRGLHIPSFLLSSCDLLKTYRLIFCLTAMTDSVFFAVYHHALKTTCKCTISHGNVANCDVILPQSNRVGISWTLIFTFAKHNLADRRVPDVFIYVIFSKHVLSKNCTTFSNCCKPTNFRGLNFCCLVINREIREIYIPQKFQHIQ